MALLAITLIGPCVVLERASTTTQDDASLMLVSRSSESTTAATNATARPAAAQGDAQALATAQTTTELAPHAELHAAMAESQAPLTSADGQAAPPLDRDPRSNEPSGDLSDAEQVAARDAALAANRSLSPALDLRADTLPRDDDTKTPPDDETLREQAEAKPPPSPPEPDEEPPDEHLEPEFADFVDLDDALANLDLVPATDLISDRTVAHADEAHTLQLAAEEGAITLRQEAVPTKAGSPVPHVIEGEVDGELGSQPTRDITEQATATAKRGGGHRGGQSQGAGSPGDGGKTEGGAFTRGRQGARSHPATKAPIPMAGGGPQGAKPAPRADDRPLASSSDWWQPTAARLVIIAPPAVHTQVVAPPPSPQKDRAPVHRPELKASHQGGTDGPSDEEATEAERSVDEQGKADEIVPFEAETIDEMRTSMGWGGINRTSLRPKQVSPGIEQVHANSPKAPQAITDSKISDEVQVTARSTLEGRYRAQLDDIIKVAYLAGDLTIEDRAIGIQGEVTLVLEVQASGRISAIVLTRSSGHSGLDQLAIQSIPERGPRFPKALRKQRRAMYHRYTFRYRNPLIGPGAGG